MIERRHDTKWGHQCNKTESGTATHIHMYVGVYECICIHTCGRHGHLFYISLAHYIAISFYVICCTFRLLPRCGCWGRQTGKKKKNGQAMAPKYTYSHLCVHVCSCVFLCACVCVRRITYTNLW